MAVILHNPRCSKSRQTLSLLQENGIEVTERRYLEDPLTAEEVLQLQHQLGATSVREMMRVKEETYKALGLKDVSDDKQLAQAIAREPKLLERPVVIQDGRAAIGRPPENVLKLFA